MTQTSFCVCFMLLCGICASVGRDGIAPEWNEVPAIQMQLMGDYVGDWLDAPEKHYYQLNTPLAAQVVPTSNASFAIRLFQQHDSGAEIYFETSAKLENETIRFEKTGWSGIVSTAGMEGCAPSDHGRVIHFALKRIVRSSSTMGALAPAGAVVLMDGKHLDQWEHPNKTTASWYLLEDGSAEVKIGTGDIQTKQSFGDCSLHMEFRYPVEANKAAQGKGNSGVFFQQSYEVQILNSYGLLGAWNECGALYKLRPPHVNMARVAGEWQTYDIDYKASVWQGNTKVRNAVISVRHNGVWIHQNEEIPHATAYEWFKRKDEKSGATPIRLQNHGNPIQFRNIWLLPISGSAQ